MDNLYRRTNVEELIQQLTRPLCPIRPTMLVLPMTPGDTVDDLAVKHLLLQPAPFFPVGNCSFMQLAHECQFQADMIVATAAKNSLCPVRSLMQGSIIRLQPYASFIAGTSLANFPSDGGATVAAMIGSLSLLSALGEGLLVAPAEHIKRLILDPGSRFAALKRFAWAFLSLDRDGVPNDQQEAWGALWFSRSWNQGPKWMRNDVAKYELAQLMDELIKEKKYLLYTPTITNVAQCDANTWPLWKAIQQEWKERNKEVEPPFEVTLNKLQELTVNISPFKRKASKPEQKWLFDFIDSLAGQRLEQVVTDAGLRARLVQQVASGTFRFDPDIAVKLQRAIDEYKSVRAPLYPLTEVQAIGYLEEEKEIYCSKDWIGSNLPAKTRMASEAYIAKPSPEAWDTLSPLPVPGFVSAFDAVSRTDLRMRPARWSLVEQRYKWAYLPSVETVRGWLKPILMFKAGKDYPLVSDSVHLLRTKQQPDMQGVDQELLRTSRELVIVIEDETKAKRYFADASCQLPEVKVEEAFAIDYSFQQLIEHFDIPIPDDVAKTKATQFEAAKVLLREIEEQANGGDGMTFGRRL